MPLKGQHCSRVIDPVKFIEDENDGYLVLGALIWGATKELREYVQLRQRAKIALRKQEWKDAHNQAPGSPAHPISP